MAPQSATAADGEMEGIAAAAPTGTCGPRPRLQLNNRRKSTGLMTMSHNTALSSVTIDKLNPAELAAKEMGKPSEYLMLHAEAFVAATSGKVRQARLLFERAIDEAREAGADIFLKGELGRKHLDGDSALQALIAGTEDHAHSAAPDLPFDRIRAAESFAEAGG